MLHYTLAGRIAQQNYQKYLTTYGIPYRCALADLGPVVIGYRARDGLLRHWMAAFKIMNDAEKTSPHSVLIKKSNNTV